MLGLVSLFIGVCIIGFHHKIGDFEKDVIYIIAIILLGNFDVNCILSVLLFIIHI